MLEILTMALNVILMSVFIVTTAREREKLIRAIIAKNAGELAAFDFRAPGPPDKRPTDDPKWPIGLS